MRRLRIVLPLATAAAAAAVLLAGGSALAAEPTGPAPATTVPATTGAATTGAATTGPGQGAASTAEHTCPAQQHWTPIGCKPGNPIEWS